MTPQPATTADQLPGVLLARILQHLPLQHRLASCALVCKAWARAAAAATHRLSVTVRQPDDKPATKEGSAAHPSSISITARQPEESSLELSGFTGWRQQHGSNLNSLQLQGLTQGWDVMSRLQLPCPALVQLDSLSLGGCVVSTAPQGPQQVAAPVSAQALPQLVDLALRSCKFASPASFQQLASLASLTALEVEHVWWNNIPQAQAGAGTGSKPSALAAALRACSRLRRLSLCCWEHAEDSAAMPPSSLDVISGLQQLEDLRVFLPDSEEGAAPAAPAALPLPDLPSGLTRLVLTPWDRYSPIGWSPVANRYSLSLLQQDLSQLRVPELCEVEVHVTVSALSSMSQLQQLVIDRCVLLPRAASLSSFSWHCWLLWVS